MVKNLRWGEGFAFFSGVSRVFSGFFLGFSKVLHLFNMFMIYFSRLFINAEVS